MFVSGLKDNIQEDKIREIFSQFGNIVDLILSRNHKNSKRKDLAFITFSSNSEAKNALEACKSFNYFDAPVMVSLSFSQQVMQAKKKIKDNRKKTTGNSDNNHRIMNSNQNNNQSNQLGNNFNLNNNNTLNNNNNSVNQNTLNSVINMLSMNKNINPTMMAQMMAIAVSMILNNQNNGNNDQNLNNIKNNVNNNQINKKKTNENIIREKRNKLKSKGKIRFHCKKTLNNSVNLNTTSNNNNNINNTSNLNEDNI